MIKKDLDFARESRNVQLRFAADGFNNTKNGSARFSPIYDDNGDIIPTIYGAETFRCATAEIILMSPDTPPGPQGGQPHIVAPRDYTLYKHSVLRTVHDLSLIELSTIGQRRSMQIMRLT